MLWPKAALNLRIQEATRLALWFACHIPRSRPNNRTAPVLHIWEDDCRTTFAYRAYLCKAQTLTRREKNNQFSLVQQSITVNHTARFGEQR
jgi:hypothetical protein